MTRCWVDGWVGGGERRREDAEGDWSGWGWTRWGEDRMTEDWRVRSVREAERIEMIFSTWGWTQDLENWKREWGKWGKRRIRRGGRRRLRRGVGGQFPEFRGKHELFVCLSVSPSICPSSRLSFFQPAFLCSVFFSIRPSIPFPSLPLSALTSFRPYLFPPFLLLSVLLSCRPSFFPSFLLAVPPSFRLSLYPTLPISDLTCFWPYFVPTLPLSDPTSFLLYLLPISPLSVLPFFRPFLLPSFFLFVFPCLLPFTHSSVYPSVCPSFHLSVLTSFRPYYLFRSFLLSVLLCPSFFHFVFSCMLPFAHSSVIPLVRLSIRWCGYSIRVILFRSSSPSSRLLLSGQSIVTRFTLNSDQWQVFSIRLRLGLDGN